MGLPAQGEGGLEALEKHALLGQEALVVDLEGEFSGMDGATVSDARLLGLILAVPVGTLFVKMTGPGELLEAERARFFEFCDSIRLEIDGQTVTGQSATKESPEESAGAEDGAAQSSPSAQEGEGRLAWKTPENWREMTPRPMREVSFFVGEGSSTECYVSILPGSAGGVAANLQRWRGQLGLDALPSEELADLPVLSVLGVDSRAIEAYGRYEGMDGAVIEEAGMRGLVSSHGDSTIFVKMIGPAETVRAAGKDFEAFCASLSWRD
jgi:hypothetical protein